MIILVIIIICAALYCANENVDCRDPVDVLGLLRT